jgi:hypothetical protein
MNNRGTWPGTRTWRRAHASPQPVQTSWVLAVVPPAPGPRHAATSAAVTARAATARLLCVLVGLMVFAMYIAVPLVFAADRLLRSPTGAGLAVTAFLVLFVRHVLKILRTTTRVARPNPLDLRSRPVRSLGAHKIIPITSGALAARGASQPTERTGTDDVTPSHAGRRESLDIVTSAVE